MKKELEKKTRKIQGKTVLKKHQKVRTLAKAKKELYKEVQLHARLRDS